ALLHGPPGTGKTMLARRLPSILPPLTPGEAVEVTRIHSIAGTREGSALMAMRPFRAPHHTISASGLVGGGARPIPGEAELADRLLARFAQPSEDARRTLARAYEDSTLSARGHARVLRVARTVADLAGSERVEVEHLVQAIGLRNVTPSLGAAA